MTAEQTAEQYLSQIKTLDFKLERMRGQEKELRYRAKFLSSPSYGERVQSTPQGGALEKAVERYMMLAEQAELAAVALEEKKAEIQQRIERVEDFRLYQVLIFRYIDCLKFEELENKMMYSYRQCRRLHQKALKVFEECNSDLFSNEENTENTKTTEQKTA